MSNGNDDRKKAEQKRLHSQPFSLEVMGFDKSIFSQSETNIRYIKEKCFEASVLFTGSGTTLASTNYSRVSKDDIFSAKDLIDDAQCAFDDPVNHPQVFHVEWRPEHKREAYRILKETRDAYRCAQGQVAQMNEISCQSLIDEAWRIFTRVKEDDPRSPHRTKPGAVFAKLKEAQALISKSYLSRVVRDDLRNKVQTLWQLVQEYIGEQQKEFEERKAAREVKNREWRERQEEHIARWTSNIERSSAFIERLEGQIYADMERKAGARSEEFADRVQGWIEEKQEKIQEVQTQIDELQNRINDVREKLNKDRS